LGADNTTVYRETRTRFGQSAAESPVQTISSTGHVTTTKEPAKTGGKGNIKGKTSTRKKKAPKGKPKSSKGKGKSDKIPSGENVWTPGADLMPFRSTILQVSGPALISRMVSVFMEPDWKERFHNIVRGLETGEDFHTKELFEQLNSSDTGILDLVTSRSELDHQSVHLNVLKIFVDMQIHAKVQW
jgi:hypothetical protein